MLALDGECGTEPGACRPIDEVGQLIESWLRFQQHRFVDSPENSKKATHFSKCILAGGLDDVERAGGLVWVGAEHGASPDGLHDDDAYCVRDDRSISTQLCRIWD